VRREHHVLVGLLAPRISATVLNVGTVPSELGVGAHAQHRALAVSLARR
jgi:hypothetical protein